MTFHVIKEQNFHLVVCIVGVYARKTGESGKCNGTCNLVPKAFPYKMGGPTNFLRESPGDEIDSYGVEDRCNNQMT